MSRSRNVLRIRLVRDGNVAHGVKEIDRYLQFLLEKLAHVRHPRATAAQINSRRRLALLLRSIMTDRSHDLRMQTCHRAPDNFRHSRDIRVGRVGIGTSETDETVFFLPA